MITTLWYFTATLIRTTRIATIDTTRIAKIWRSQGLSHSAFAMFIPQLWTELEGKHCWYALWLRLWQWQKTRYKIGPLYWKPLMLEIQLLWYCAIWNVCMVCKFQKKPMENYIYQQTLYVMWQVLQSFQAICSYLLMYDLPSFLQQDHRKA